jgi:hypothetical protein
MKIRAFPVASFTEVKKSGLPRRVVTAREPVAMFPFA